MLALVCVLPFLTAVAHAATCRWAWDPVTTYSDGTPVLDLAGYRLYHSPDLTPATPYTEVPAPATTATVPCAVGETWHVTAYRAAGQESAPSAPVIVPDLFAAAAPGGFRLEGATLQLTITRE